MNPELTQSIVSAITNPPMEGWCTPEKALAMAQLIIEQKPHVVVEIGVFGGRSLVPQAMALRENNRGMIYGIDAWRKEVAIEGDNSKENDDWWLKLDIEYIHRHCMENIWKNRLDAWATVLRTSSQHCPHLFAGIDILHIDGAHSEVASVRDVQNYLPRVRPGGHIWFDDTDWATTQKAVELVKQECAQVGGSGSCILFRKK